MNNLEKVYKKRQRLDKKQKEVAQLKAQLIRDGIASIFEALDIKARPELNRLNHSSNRINVTLREDVTGFRMEHNGVHSTVHTYFEVETNIDNLMLKLLVRDAESHSLVVFKEILRKAQEMLNV